MPLTAMTPDSGDPDNGDCDETPQPLTVTLSVQRALGRIQGLSA